MPSAIRNICLDARDAWELAQFWSAVFGRPLGPDDQPGDEEVGIELPETDGAFILNQVPEPKTGKNRMHICLRPDGPRDEEVARILDLGATLVDDLRRPDGRGWAVLADPEGNEFCVLRSAAERAATAEQG